MPSHLAPLANVRLVGGELPFGDAPGREFWTTDSTDHSAPGIHKARCDVIAGTDCGFSQFWDSIRVHPSVQWAKLQALVDGAKLANAKLWGAH
jgi:hypothetical protein